MPEEYPPRETVGEVFWIRFVGPGIWGSISLNYQCRRIKPMTEIDDEMVERAFRWLNDNAGFGGHPFDESRRQVRCALEAALSPPKLEIEVTEGMTRAGYEAAGGFYAISEHTVENIYRAMESTRLKQAKS